MSCRQAQEYNDECGSCRKARVYNDLRSFLVDMGFQPEEVSSLKKCEGLGKGLFVCFLSKGGNDVAGYLSLANDTFKAVDCTIPVLFDKECETEGPSMGDRLYVPAYGTPLGVGEDERCRAIGADIIQALSKRVASALLL